MDISSNNEILAMYNRKQRLAEIESRYANVRKDLEKPDKRTLSILDEMKKEEIQNLG